MLKALVLGAHQELFSLIERLVEDGRDLYRILLDLQMRVRSSLLRAIQAGGNAKEWGRPISVESLSRMLDALQAAEPSVRQGLSQRVNFEVALLRAIEQSRTRSIDTLIKELNGIANSLPLEPVEKKI